MTTRDCAGATIRKSSVRKAAEDSRVIGRVHRATELRLSQSLVDLLDVAELLPGGRHQRFLLILDDLRAHRRGRPLTRIEIEIVQPERCRPGRRCLSALRYFVDARMPASIDRRSHHRVAGRSSLRGELPRCVEQAAQRGLKRHAHAVVPRVRTAADHAQGTLEPEDRAGRVCWRLRLHHKTRAFDAHRTLADVARQFARPQPSHQLFEVAANAGAELPEMEHGERDLLGRLRTDPHAGVRSSAASGSAFSPARRPTSNAGTTQASIRGARQEPARAEQARHVLRRLRVEHGLQFSAAGPGDLRMRPQMRLREVGQLVARTRRRGDLEHRQWLRGRRAQHHTRLFADRDGQSHGRRRP